MPHLDELKSSQQYKIPTVCSTMASVGAGQLVSTLRWTAKGFRKRELILLLFIDLLLYPCSRDTLQKYYRRVEELLARDF